MADNGLLPALSNDDVRRILGMEPEEPRRTIGGTLKDVGVTLGNAAIGAGESVVGLGNLATFGGLGKAMNAAGYDPKAARKFLSQYYSDAQKKANKEVEDAQGFWDTAGAMLRNPSTIAATAVESAPSMYLGGGIGGKGLQLATKYLPKAAPRLAEKYLEKQVGRAAPGLATDVASRYLAKETGKYATDEAGRYILNAAGRKALGRTAAAIGEGAVAGGALAEQMRQETPDKELTGQQALYAGLGGALTGGIGRIGSGLAGRMGIADVDTLITAGIGAAGRNAAGKLTAGQIVKGLTGGALTEGIFEELPQSMQEQIWTNLGTGKPWHEDVFKAGAQGMMAGFLMGAGANARVSTPKMQRQLAAIGEAERRARLDSEYRGLQAGLERGGNTTANAIPGEQGMNVGVGDGTANTFTPGGFGFSGSAFQDAVRAGREQAFREAEEQRSVGVIGKALNAGGFASTVNRAPTGPEESLLAQQQSDVDLTPTQRAAEATALEREANAPAPLPAWDPRVTTEATRRAAETQRTQRRMDAMAAAEQEQERLWEMRPEAERLRNALTGVQAQRAQQDAEAQYAQEHGLVYTGDTTIPANALVRGDRVQVRDAQGRPDIARVRGTTDDGRIILQDGVRMTFGEDEDVPIQALSLDEHAGRQRQGWGFKTKAERDELRAKRAQRRAFDAIQREDARQRRQYEAEQAAQAKRQAVEDQLQAVRDAYAADRTAQAEARRRYTGVPTQAARNAGAPSSEMDAALGFLPDDLPTPGDSALEAQGENRLPSQRQAEEEHDARMQQPAPPPKPETKKERQDREKAELEQALQVASPLWRDRIVTAQDKLADAKKTKDKDAIQAAENRLRAAVQNALKSAPAQEQESEPEVPDHDQLERQYYGRQLSDVLQGRLGFARGRARNLTDVLRGRIDSMKAQAAAGIEGLLADAREAAPARRLARRKAKAEARAPYIEQEMRERGRQWQEREQQAQQAQQDAANEQTRQANRAAGRQWMEERAASGDIGPADGVTRANRAPRDEMESLMGHRSTPAMDQAEQAGAANQAKQQADTLMQQALQSPMSKAVKAARKELTAVKKTKDQTAIQRAEEHLARVVSNAVQARQQRLAVEQRKARERMAQAQAAHDEKEAKYAAEQLRQVQEQRTALAQVLTNIAQGKPGDLTRALSGLAQQRTRQREGNAIQMPGPQTPALLPYLPQETAEPEEPPIQKQAENNFPRIKKSGNAAKAGTASKTGVEGNRGADEFMFNSEGAPMLGYRPGNAGQNATARAENVATGTRENAKEVNRKPAGRSTVTGKSERTMVTEEREGQPMPAPQAAPAKQGAPKQIEYKPQPTYPGEAVIPQGQQGGFGFRPKGQRQAQALLPLLPQQETQMPQERRTPPAYPGRPQAPALPRNERTTGATQERQAPAMPRQNPSLQRAMRAQQAEARTESGEATRPTREATREAAPKPAPAHDEFVETLRKNGWVVNALGITYRLVEVKSRPGTFRVVGENGDTRYNFGGKGLPLEEAAEKAWQLSAETERAVDFDGFIQRQQEAERQKNDSQIRQERVQRKLAESKERLRQVAAAKERDARIKAIKDRIQSLPFPHREPGESLKEYKDRRQALARAQREELARAYGLDTSTMDAEQSTAGNTTAEQNDTLSARKWTKPGKKVFKSGIPNPDIDYFGVRLNGGEDAGYTNGFIIIFGFVPDGVDTQKKGKEYDGADSLRVSMSHLGSDGEATGKLFPDAPYENNFDNALTYRGVLEGNAVFERARGQGALSALQIDDKYLNAIMYYAQKRHGKNADVRFIQDSRRNYRGQETNTGPVAVFVNGDPFAVVMPMVSNSPLDELLGKMRAARQEREADKAGRPESKAAPESTAPPQTPSKGKRETETENLPGWAKDAGYTIRKAESGEGFEVYRDTERLDGLSGTYEEALERVEGLTAIGFFFVKGKVRYDFGKRRIVYKIGFKNKRNGALRDDQFLDTPEFTSTYEARVYLLDHLSELWERRAEKLKANNRTAKAEEQDEQKTAADVTQEDFLAALDYSRQIINSVGTTYVVQPMASRTGAYHVFAITKDGRREQLNKKGLSREEAKQLVWETSEEERTGRREIAKDVRPLGRDEIGEAPVGTELQRGKQVYRKLKLGQWGRKGPNGSWLPQGYTGNLDQEAEWERRNHKEAARTRDPQHPQRTAYEQRYIILSRLPESEREKLQGWGLLRLREYQNSKEYIVQQLKYVGYAPISETSDIIIKRNDDGGFTLRRRDYLTKSGRDGRERYTDIGTYATMDEAVNAAVEQVPRFAETTRQVGTETGAETSSEPLTPAEVEEIKSHINNMWRRKATFTGKDGVSYTVKEQRLSGIENSKTGFLYTVTAKTANGKESKPAYSDTKAKAVTIVVGMINDNLKAAREQAGTETRETRDPASFGDAPLKADELRQWFVATLEGDGISNDPDVHQVLNPVNKRGYEIVPFPGNKNRYRVMQVDLRNEKGKTFISGEKPLTRTQAIALVKEHEAANQDWIDWQDEMQGDARTRVKLVARMEKMRAERDQAPAESAPKKEKGIADKLGEHIGGSRADMAQKTGPRGGVKTAGKLPEWAKGYSLRQVEAEYALYYKGEDLRGRFATVEQAIEYLRARVAAEHFFVTRSNKDRLYKIAARNTRNGRRGYFLDTPGFENGNEANRYLLEHLPELMETRDGKNKQRRGPRQKGFGEADLATAETSERVGKERRTGDATPEDFMSAFGFRGVEFGLWNNQKDRQALLNDAYDALMDLADLLGIPPKALSLNGELALAFGARGKGGKKAARAHYEPDKVVINLTKTSGKGTLAHEWMHALDYYFGGRGESKGPLSEHFRGEPENVRPEVYEAFRNVKATIFGKDGWTNFYEAARRFRNTSYWANNREMLARAFSAYIEDTLKERGEKSDFLSYGSNNDLYGEEWSSKPFPEGEERQAINRAFAEFFDTLEVDDSEGRAALYSKTDRAVPPEERANIEAELRESLGRGKADNLLGDKGSVRIIETQEEARRIIAQAESGGITAQKSTSADIAAKYPNWMDNQVITSSDSKKGQQTQIAGTRSTYAKVGKWIQNNLGMGVQVLDASSGMGLGTLELREQGFATDDIEPYPGGGRMESNPPTFSGTDAYQQAMDSGKRYDFIISNAVLNVIPDDWRNAVLRDMAALLKPGGKMFINTRKAGEEKSIKNKIELDSPQEVLVGTPEKITSYQRFFTPEGLVRYVQEQLGDGYTVEVANTKNSGTSGLAAVVVTKNGATGVKYSADGRIIQGFYLNGAAYLVRDGIARGNVMGVLMHEYGEHAAQLGFRNNVGYRAILESLKRRQNENSETGRAIQAAMQRARNAGVNERDPHFWSEVAAYIVEANANIKTSTLDRVTNFFKKWLFKVSGLGADNFTHKDLVMFARAAVKAASVAGDRASSLPDGAQRVAQALRGMLKGLRVVVGQQDVVAAARRLRGLQKLAGIAYPDAGDEIKGIRLAVGKKRRDEYRQLLAKHRPDLDAGAVLNELDAYDDPKKEKIALHWVIKGAISLPEDGYKVDDALSVAGKAKVDPYRYESPMALIEAHKEFKPTARPIDPATVPELSDPRDEGGGIVSYEVQDDRDGQLAMRRIINTHWGEDANPWCLLHGDGHGNLSDGSDGGYDAWEYWNKYSALPKRVAFKNGRLLAFMATENHGEDAIDLEDRLAELRDPMMGERGIHEYDVSGDVSNTIDEHKRVLESANYFLSDLGEVVWDKDAFSDDEDELSLYPIIDDLPEKLRKKVNEFLADDTEEDFDPEDDIEEWRAALEAVVARAQEIIDEEIAAWDEWVENEAVRVSYRNNIATIVGIDGDTIDFDDPYGRTPREYRLRSDGTYVYGGEPEEEWWDRQDKSHPDLDWAKGGGIREARGETAALGAYDPATKAVFLSREADERTVAHEMLGHALWDWSRRNAPALHAKMRQFAEDAPRHVVDHVMRNYPAEVRNDREALLDELCSHALAEDEVIAGMLKGEAEKSWWRRILTAVRVLWRRFVKANRADLGKYERLSPQAAMRAIAQDALEGKTFGSVEAQGGRNDDIRFSIAASSPAAPAANPAANNTVTGRSFVDRILANAKPKYQDMWERFIYNFIDNNDPRERLWKKAGSPTDQDFVTVERLRGKKAAAEQKKFREEMVTPLLKTLAQGKLAVSDLEEYAYAMHTPERNQKMREVNAKRNLDALRRHMPKAEAQDLQDRIDFVRTVGKANGWTTRDIQQAYLGMMEEVFNDIPRRENMLAQAQANLTAASSNNARAHAHVDKMRRDLDETKAIRDRWRRESVRFAGQTDQEAQATIQKWQRDGRFRALQNAHNQLEAITAATLDVLHESGYLSDEEFLEIKNGYQHYVPLHRDGFLDTTPIKLMQVAKGSMRDVVNILPNVVRSHETAVNRKHKAAAGRALYEFAEANPDAGISIEEMEMKPTHDQEGNIVMYRSQAEPEDGIFVRVNGKKYLLRFAASSKTAEGRTLLRFLDAVKGSDRQMNSMVRALHWVTRKLAMVNTSLSPEFMVTNFARDLQTAFVHLNQKDIDMPGLQKAVAHDVFPAMRGIWAAERGDKTSAMAKWYADFQANGGKVGWMQGYEEAETLAKDLQKELKLYQPGNHGRKAFDKIKRLVEHGNAAIENCMRLATYKNLVERGVSKDKAARIASGLTVDFTQHGKMGPQINALYMFWNASVQGSVRMIQALASSRKVQAIAGGIASAGFLLQMLALAGGGDDDSGEPYILGIPDAIRERNIIIMLPGSDGKYIKIPKAYGYGALYDFGAEVANSLYMGAQGRKYNHAAGAMRVITSFANSFNPVQSATMLQTLAPTLLDPVAYVSENRSWMGTPLMPEQSPYGPSKPDSERAWKGTSPIFKKLAKTLNDMTGGDAYKGGWADISPETFSMVWDNATGGMGRFIGNTLALPFTVAAGDTEAHKIPFARTVYGEWNDRAISSRYYEAMDRAEIAHMRFKNAGNLAERRRLYQEPDHKLYLQSRKAEAQIKKLRKRQQQLEAAGNKDGAERIRTRIVAAQSRVLAGMPN